MNNVSVSHNNNNTGTYNCMHMHTGVNMNINGINNCSNTFGCQHVTQVPPNLQRIRRCNYNRIRIPQLRTPPSTTSYSVSGTNTGTDHTNLQSSGHGLVKSYHAREYVKSKFVRQSLTNKDINNIHNYQNVVKLWTDDAFKSHLSKPTKPYDQLNISNSTNNGTELDEYNLREWREQMNMINNGANTTNIRSNACVKGHSLLQCFEKYPLSSYKNVNQENIDNYTKFNIPNININKDNDYTLVLLTNFDELMQCFNDKYHTRYPVYPNAYLDYCCLEFGQYSIQNASNSSNNNNTNNSDTNYTVQRRYIAFSKRSSSEMKKYVYPGKYVTDKHPLDDKRFRYKNVSVPGNYGSKVRIVYLISFL